MILVVDNYDSFTWNLVHCLREIGAAIEVVRNDEISVVDAVASGAAGFLISPGPGTPDDAGISLDLVAACEESRLPLLGICLGHQAIGQHLGGRVARAPQPMHGKACMVDHDGTGLFEHLPSPFTAARYHSLALVREALPECLIVTATAADTTVQAIRHRDLPIHGVQFHPESVVSEYGHALLRNFLKIVGQRR